MFTADEADIGGCNTIVGRPLCFIPLSDLILGEIGIKFPLATNLALESIWIGQQHDTNNH
jgi:hypothetical protein